MRLNLKNLNFSTKRLADGTVRTYWYAWRGGPRLDGEPGTPEFVASYNKALAGRADTDGKTLAQLIRDYCKGAYFRTKLADRTRADYTKKLTLIEDKFGDMPLAACQRPETRGVFRRWRDELAVASERQADYTWSVMSAVFAHGIEYGDVTVNPCARGGRIYDGSRSEVIWTSPQIGAFLTQRQYAHMHLPLMIGLWTGQREGDVLRLRWRDYDGAVWRCKQRKGRRKRKQHRSTVIAIPIAVPLKAALDAALAARKRAVVRPMDLGDECVCLNSEGEPWREGRDGYNGFISSFRKAKDKAGIEGVNFADLRGTAVTRLALAGSTVPEICAITGHSHDEANRILEAHYLHRDPQIAWNAIRKLEAYMGATISVDGTAPDPAPAAVSFQTGPQTAVPVLSMRTEKTQ